MLIDRGDKCRCLKISNPKIEDVVLGAVRVADHNSIGGRAFRLPCHSVTIPLSMYT